MKIKIKLSQYSEKVLIKFNIFNEILSFQGRNVNNLQDWIIDRLDIIQLIRKNKPIKIILIGYKSHKIIELKERIINYNLNGAVYFDKIKDNPYKTTKEYRKRINDLFNSTTDLMDLNKKLKILNEEFTS